MTPEALEALKESIEAWKKKLILTQVWRGEEIKWGWRACPLCCEFNRPSASLSGSECEGCPVFSKTGEVHCDGTPYIDAVTASNDYERNKTFENAWDLMEKIEVELNFLISLLPKEGEQHV